MENPVLEIPAAIRLLTQGVPSLQEKAIERFFTQDAAFIHPFCRVPHFEGSRWYITKIFQWYKCMSPRVEIEIHSTAFDEKNLKLYVHMSQIFSIWVVPFHVAPGENRTDGVDTLYYITQQEDLYQTSEFVKFILPHVGYWLVLGWHLIATLFCVLGSFFLWPMLWLEENGYLPGWIAKGNVAYDMDLKIHEIKQS
ncbi:hypothetical protein N7468_009726 [Penicillium chermesinum]|uniref:SigF-like NTF2-like domain-containing protein n=1 Tax=Penicillium chermesinum TaxID=63820 RepID=A0A9W9NIG7_9EURO|nr:uncharacterized protein N7468_009726 [Penicillium chermesinum]KAJ5220522.1 hypothetical protein N7468_009726 [Penicillium chermesinum]KAJ6157953.1 hypothetical protein N7470_005545 [Penicillium chermesinum]